MHRKVQPRLYSPFILSLFSFSSSHLSSSPPPMTRKWTFPSALSSPSSPLFVPEERLIKSFERWSLLPWFFFRQARREKGNMFPSPFSQDQSSPYNFDWKYDSLPLVPMQAPFIGTTRRWRNTSELESNICIFLIIARLNQDIVIDGHDCLSVV